MISEFWGLCHNCVLTKAREQWERPCHSILAFLVPLGFQPSWTQNQTTHTSRSLSNCRPGARTATSARPQRQEPRGTNRAGTTTVSANGTRKRTGHVERHGGEGLMPSSKRTWWDNHRAFSLDRVWSKLSPPKNESMAKGLYSGFKSKWHKGPQVWWFIYTSLIIFVFVPTVKPL